MSGNAARNKHAPIHPLAWQGWQLDLPGDWNPARLTGNWRAGSMVVADLEQERLELDWRQVRSGRSVDLTRLGRREKKTLTWKPIPPKQRPNGFSEAQTARTDTGEIRAVLVSARSSRLLFARIMADIARRPNPVADSILNSLRDTAAGEPVPWYVYGFSWSTPAHYRLWRYQFAAGRASLTFRRGRRTLTFERRTLAGDQPTGQSQQPGQTVLSHEGHKVHLATNIRRTPWDRLLRGPDWRAEWLCPDSRRQFHLRATGHNAETTLREAIQSVRCHQPA